MPLELTLPLQEQNALCRYLYIDNNNIVHFFLPIVGGNHIAIDNTCESLGEIKRFFWGDEDSPSAKNQLLAYCKALDHDIALLREHDMLDAAAERQSRLDQVMGYIKLLRSINTSIYSPLYNCFHSARPQYPKVIKDFLAQMPKNLYGIHLSPRVFDGVMHTLDPICSFYRRNPRAQLAPQLRNLNAPLKERILFALEEHVINLLGPEVFSDEPVFLIFNPNELINSILTKLEEALSQECTPRVIDFSGIYTRNLEDITAEYLEIECGINDLSNASRYPLAIVNALIEEESWSRLENQFVTVPLKKRVEDKVKAEIEDDDRQRKIGYNLITDMVAIIEKVFSEAYPDSPINIVEKFNAHREAIIHGLTQLDFTTTPSDWVERIIEMIMQQSSMTQVESESMMEIKGDLVSEVVDNIDPQTRERIIRNNNIDDIVTRLAKALASECPDNAEYIVQLFNNQRDEVSHEKMEQLLLVEEGDVAADYVEPILHIIMQHVSWAQFEQNLMTVQLEPSMEQRDIFSLKVQFFLAHINLYLYEVMGVEVNIGLVIEQNPVLMRDFLSMFKTARHAYINIEQYLIQFINENKAVFSFDQDIGDEGASGIIQRCRANWTTIENSPHFDEFFIFAEDPHQPGLFFSYNGFMGLPFFNFFDNYNHHHVEQQLVANKQSDLLHLQAGPRHLSPNTLHRLRYRLPWPGDSQRLFDFYITALMQHFEEAEGQQPNRVNIRYGYENLSNDDLFLLANHRLCDAVLARLASHDMDITNFASELMNYRALTNEDLPIHRLKLTQIQSEEDYLYFRFNYPFINDYPIAEIEELKGQFQLLEELYQLVDENNASAFAQQLLAAQKARWVQQESIGIFIKIIMAEKNTETTSAFILAMLALEEALIDIDELIDFTEERTLHLIDYSMANSHWHLVLELLSRGAKFPDNILLQACQAKAEKAVIISLSEVVGFDGKNNKTGNVLLHELVLRGDADTITEWLNSSLHHQQEMINNEKLTPLLLALNQRPRNWDVIRALLPPCHTETGEIEMALMRAAKDNQFEICQALLALLTEKINEDYLDNHQLLLDVVLNYPTAPQGWAQFIDLFLQNKNIPLNQYWHSRQSRDGKFYPLVYLAREGIFDGFMAHVEVIKEHEKNCGIIAYHACVHQQWQLMQGLCDTRFDFKASGHLRQRHLGFYLVEFEQYPILITLLENGRVENWRGNQITRLTSIESVSSPRSSNRTCATNASGFRIKSRFRSRHVSSNCCNLIEAEFVI